MSARVGTGRALGLPRDELSVVFHTTLVRAIGCTSHASENADFFEDDIAFQGWLKEINLGDEAVLSRQLARFGEPQCRQLETAGLLHDIGRAGVPVRSGTLPGRTVGDHKITALRHYTDTAKHIAAWNGEDTTRMP